MIEAFLVSRIRLRAADPKPQSAQYSLHQSLGSPTSQRKPTRTILQLKHNITNDLIMSSEINKINKLVGTVHGIPPLPVHARGNTIPLKNRR